MGLEMGALGSISADVRHKAAPPGPAPWGYAPVSKTAGYLTGKNLYLTGVSGNIHVSYNARVTGYGADWTACQVQMG